MKNFDRENFLLDLLSIEWSEIIQLDKEDPNLSFKLYFTTINKLIDQYMPLKKMTNKEIKQQQKPWITKEILRTMNERDKIHKKWVGEKDIVTKTSLHTDYKNIRNRIREDILTNKKKIL